MNQNRNWGIDALRIVSMFMIVLLHMLGEKGILVNTVPLSLKYEVAWGIEIASYCAVNCYALISGYVGVGRRTHPYSKLIGLWCQIFFYTGLITLFFSICGLEKITRQQVVNAFFPIMSRQYWYLSAYFGMVLLLPVLNNAIDNLSQKELRVLLSGVFIFMSLVPSILKLYPFDLDSDVFLLGNGYSVLWLCIIYMWGGYIRKYNIGIRMNIRKSIGLFFLMVFVTWLSKYILETLPLDVFRGLKYGNTFITYTSPTIVGASLFLLFAFVKMKLSKTHIKIISLLAPATLGVYIIHANLLMWEKKINGIAAPLANCSILILVPGVFLLAVIIYVLCSAIELVRIKIFQITKINVLFRRIESLIDRKIC